MNSSNVFLGDQIFRPLSLNQEIRIAASPERVWQVLTHIPGWARWQTDIRKPRLLDTVSVGGEFRWTTGGARIRSRLHTVQAYKAFGWTGKTMGLYAVHNWSLQEEGGQTLVQVDESMVGFLARWFQKKFNKNLERDMRHWLVLLKAECEKTSLQ